MMFSMPLKRVRRKREIEYKTPQNNVRISAKSTANYIDTSKIVLKSCVFCTDGGNTNISILKALYQKVDFHFELFLSFIN